MKEAKSTDRSPREIVYRNGTRGLDGDFPIAVVCGQKFHNTLGVKLDNQVVDPIFDWHVRDNLYGRVMTLLEATCDPEKLKAVKDVFSKEINSWANDVHSSAREIAIGGDSSENIYTRR